MPWDNASFSGRPETEPVDKNKVQEESHGAHFLTSWKKKKSWDFFPYAQSPGAALLHSIKAVCLVLHPQWQNAPGLISIDPDKPGTCPPPWQMERAGVWHRS